MHAAWNALLEEFVTRWNAHDADQLVALFADDATFTDVVGQTGSGRAGIAAQHQYPFTHVQRRATFTPNQTHWHPVTEDVAVGTVYWTTTGSETPAGESLPPCNGVMQLVVRQQHGHWHIVSALNADLLRGPYAPQATPTFL
ncbi:uncharacterized protein (TIGR02246 family) [Hymenobacter luteus]|uniref:Uncharacterized protein (TIGR02246 family) n=2 Tax=Hymenobacter TaxID=89966 RepID=A0A7W9T4W3_9BACT|nr:MULTISPECIES: nuclear transport factor 2 family protein [Hymenobacter]MBB4603733.1 uncharacterized protein (TIGR02246 family) [Hymenobacter latericoloratus]MBB6061511.1 uncharacterized protein (TIGR02246 family) [Hymenobacter luteus]